MGLDPLQRIETINSRTRNLLDKLATLYVGGFFIFCTSFAFGDVVIVVPEGNNSVMRIAKDIKQQLPEFQIVILESNQSINFPEKTELIVTLGNEWGRLIDDIDPVGRLPVISSFLNRSNWKKREQKLAIFNDIDLKLQTNLVSILFNNKPVNIGIFIPEKDSYFEKEILKLNRLSHVKIHARKISVGEDPAKLVGPFSEENAIDAFILLPSKDLFDPHTVSATLFSLYQHRVAAIVSSPKLVEKGVGGVAGTYFTRDQVITEVRDQVKEFFANKAIIENVTTPRIASIAINEKLIKALDLNLKGVTETRLLMNE